MNPSRSAGWLARARITLNSAPASWRPSRSVRVGSSMPGSAASTRGIRSAIASPSGVVRWRECYVAERRSRHHAFVVEWVSIARVRTGRRGRPPVRWADLDAAAGVDLVDQVDDLVVALLHLVAAGPALRSHVVTAVGRGVRERLVALVDT